MIVADSDVLIDALRGREPGRGRVVRGIEAGALVTTSITYFELLAGARNELDRERVVRFLRAFDIWHFDQRAATFAAELRQDLESRGLPIAMADCLIAGICLAHSARLLTRNHKHFLRVPGLDLVGLDGDGGR